MTWVMDARVFLKNMVIEYHKNKPKAKVFLKNRHYRKIIKFISLLHNELQNQRLRKMPFLAAFSKDSCETWASHEEETDRKA